MRIVETPTFTKRVDEILSEEKYRLLQIKLIDEPEAGNIIKGSGGIRKIRWSGSGRGKEADLESCTIGIMRKECY